MKIIEKPATRREWLGIRKRGIGGSDISAIIGLNRFKSAYELYLDKIDKNIKDSPASEKAQIGIEMEEWIRRKFERETGKKVDLIEGTIVDEEYDFLLANVDGFIFLEHAGFEAKNTGAYFEKDWAEGNIPQEYWIQCQWYMMICKANKWYIAVLIGGNYFKWYAIDRNEEVISTLRKEAINFWNENVLKQIPPETQGGNSETEFLNDLFSEEEIDNEEVLELEDKAEKDILRLETIKEEIKVLKHKQQQIENKFKVKMANKYTMAETKKYEIIYENTKVFDEAKFKQEQQETYKQYILEQFDIKTFKEKAPKLYSDYCVMPKGKKFKIKKKK